jgi:ankyrin repeat protein
MLVEVPLLQAVVNENVRGEITEAVSLLIGAGANPNAISIVDGVERTALAWVCRPGHCSSAVQALLEGGAEPCWQERVRGGAAIHYAAGAGRLKTCKLLIAASGGRVLALRDDEGEAALNVAARSQHLHLVKLFCEHGADLNTVDIDGRPALYSAVALHDHTLLEYLLSRDTINVSVVFRDGHTPLHAAAERGYFTAVKLLVQRGADITAVSHEGVSIMFSAACGGSVEMIQYFMSLGLSLSVKLKAGQSVLVGAAQDGRTAAAQFLIEQGVSATALDSTGYTPLLYAAMWGHADTLKLLLRAGADVHHAAPRDATALYLVANRQIKGPRAEEACTDEQYLQCAEALLDAGADAAYTMESSGSTCLIAAVIGKHTELVELLLQCGAAAAINSQYHWCGCCGSTTALAICGDVTTVKLLLAAGADVHKTSVKGYTCLHTAVIHKRPAPKLCLLIKAGVDLAAKNEHGHTAAEIAHSMGSYMTATLLIRAAKC